MGIMKTLGVVFIGFAVCFLSTQASATLGEPIDSSTKNLSSGKVSAKVSNDALYSVHEYEDSGNTVKEFASKDGVVFAVSWRGVSKPDLDKLFGAYFKEYSEGLREVPKQYGVKTINFKTTKLVVRRGGRMRDMRGFVFAPALVPAGVNVEDLQ